MAADRRPFCFLCAPASAVRACLLNRRRRLRKNKRPVTTVTGLCGNHAAPRSTACGWCGAHRWAVAHWASALQLSSIAEARPRTSGRASAGPARLAPCHRISTASIHVPYLTCGWGVMKSTQGPTILPPRSAQVHVCPNAWICVPKGHSGGQATTPSAACPAQFVRQYPLPVDCVCWQNLALSGQPVFRG